MPSPRRSKPSGCSEKSRHPSRKYPDGRLVIAYTPVSHSFTVDMTKLSGKAAAQWFDPANGTYQPVQGSPLVNVGTHQFTSPGSNSAGDGDWVLLLEVLEPGGRVP
jgi:hypothetical protein